MREHNAATVYWDRPPNASPVAMATHISQLSEQKLVHHWQNKGQGSLHRAVLVHNLYRACIAQIPLPLAVSPDVLPTTDPRHRLWADESAPVGPCVTSLLGSPGDQDWEQVSANLVDALALEGHTHSAHVTAWEGSTQSEEMSWFDACIDEVTSWDDDEDDYGMDEDSHHEAFDSYAHWVLPPNEPPTVASATLVAPVPSPPASPERLDEPRRPLAIEYFQLGPSTCPTVGHPTTSSPKQSLPSPDADTDDNELPPMLSMSSSLESSASLSGPSRPASPPLPLHTPHSLEPWVKHQDSKPVVAWLGSGAWEAGIKLDASCTRSLMAWPQYTTIALDAYPDEPWHQLAVVPYTPLHPAVHPGAPRQLPDFTQTATDTQMSPGAVEHRVLRLPLCTPDLLQPKLVANEAAPWARDGLNLALFYE
ncbi:hypothetical protein H4R34_000278 [Dimargaris verticillata]|uniref:Uncharacterized protein n=1 Tax=Dimargaris verticillata TaxID=2761393 RepID=A0A9W8B5K9_9FUNG|nr:hypothetical protein H4R34_000278 [Dimargaris verticillata]